MLRAVCVVKIHSALAYCARTQAESPGSWGLWFSLETEGIDKSRRPQKPSFTDQAWISMFRSSSRAD